MSCENPNNAHRTIHLTSQQQASEAAYCMPDGNQDKGPVMTIDQHGGLCHRLVLTEADLP